MKQFLIFVRKEFYHVFRDKRTLLILFGLPIVQILLFGFALTSEIKHAKIVIMDFAKDQASQSIITKISSSEYFDIVQSSTSYEDMQKAFRQNKASCALIFPTNFSSDLTHTGKAQVQIIADASDPNNAKALTNYLTNIINGYTAEQNQAAPYQIQPELRMLYNPELNGSMNFVPGVIALIMMIICTTLTSVSIVKEKEMGTMEVLLVSPFKPLYVILSKAVPYLALAFTDLIIILLMSAYVIGMPIRGNIPLLLGESILFIITCLSFGLLISGFANSQQTAMLISMMGMMLPTILFTGFIFPLENMPAPLQVIANFIPSKWYYNIVKSVMLKGLGFSYIRKETFILILITVILLTVSLKKFKKRLE
ncbi:MAG: ABC transporter permease [Chitinophagaceae bacterium]|jgi:ABC-2 type transport system permease protein|nr:ABC transporter permease [Chitinophagaceae bacterium]